MKIGEVITKTISSLLKSMNKNVNNPLDNLQMGKRRTLVPILLLLESKCSPRCFLLKQINELSWVSKIVPSCLSKCQSTEFQVQELSHRGIISLYQCSALTAVIIQPRNMIILHWVNSSKWKSADLQLGKARWITFWEVRIWSIYLFKNQSEQF